jgi:hypothetical protein
MFLPLELDRQLLLIIKAFISLEAKTKIAD